MALIDMLTEIGERLGRIEGQMKSLVSLDDQAKSLAALQDQMRCLVTQKVVKDYYSIAEVAKRVGRSEYQVREWCRTGRLAAVKKNTGRGRSKEWMVPQEELTRHESHGFRSVSQSPA
jgi:predicted transcriptional regulator